MKYRNVFMTLFVSERSERNGKNMKKIKVMDIVLLVLSIVLCVGIKLVFHACEVMEDKIMACHWAEQAVFALSIVLVIQALGLIVFSKMNIRKGVCMAMIPAAIITAIIPGGFINLCMMNDMRCHISMRPAVIILSIIIAVCALINVLAGERKE